MKMVLDHVAEYWLVYAARQVIGPESLRNWVLQAQVAARQRPGATTATAANQGSRGGEVAFS